MPKTVTLKGDAVTVAGTEVRVGDNAPDVQLSKNLKESVKLSDFKGSTVVVCAVPSLDTPVCDREGQRFNKEAEKLGDKVKVLMVSMDLPPAQARWCGAHDAKNVTVLSDYKHREFGQKYGVLLPELGIFARAVFVVGPDSKVKYVEYVPEIANEPNYDACLAALKN